MGIAARIAAGAGGALLLIFGLASWTLLVETASEQSMGAVELAVRIHLWLVSTVGGGLLYRLALRPSGAPRQGRRRALLTCLIALAVSAAAALGYVLLARWITVSDPTNGWYAICLLPFAILLFVAGVTFYFSGWTAFAVSHRFEVPLLLLPPAGAALLSGVFVFLHP